MNSNNAHFDMQNAAFAHSVLAKAQASGVSLFLYDRTQTNTPISFLYSTGISAEINAEYAVDTHKYDPLIPHTASVISHCKTYTGINYKGMKPTQELHAGCNEQYWDKLGHDGFFEAAARIHSLSSNLYLIVGMLSNEPKKHLSIENAMGDVEDWLQESSKFLIESSIRHYYSHNEANQPRNQTTRGLERLTQRETHVVYELLQGNSNKQIGHNLSLSEYTIENHLRRIYKKFGVRSRLSLLAYIRNV